MSQVFISYSHKDKDFALYLAYRLSLYGVAIWIDESQLFGGDDLHKSIRVGLKASDALLLVVSPDSLCSENVRKEWDYFSRQCKPRQILPLILRPVKIEEMPKRLRGRIYIDDFLKVKGFESGFGMIIKTLNNYGLDVNTVEGYSTHRRNLTLEEADAKGFYLPNPQIFLSNVEHLIKLFESAREFYRRESLVEISQYESHSLRALAEGKISQSNSWDLWNKVSAYLNWIQDCLTDKRLPLYMNNFHICFNLLMSKECLLLEQNKGSEIEGFLPIDERLLNLLWESGQQGIQEYEKRAKVRRVYIFPLDKIHHSIVAAGLNIHGISSVKPNEQLPNMESRIIISCGEVKAHWNHIPSTAEINAATNVAQKLIDDNFWYMSDMSLT